MKKLYNSDQTKLIALETITEMAALVKQTLGPGGNPIILQQQGSNPDGSPRWPIITKDGVSVAQSISFRNPAKNTIAQAIIQVAQNTVNQTGDGTTTAVVLAEAIYKAGYKHIKQGLNGIQLYNQIKELKTKIIEKLTEVAIPIGFEEVREVAKISANGDEDVAQIVYEALKAVGEDGHVTLEEGYTKDTSLQVVEGTKYAQGWRRFGGLGYLMVNDKVRNICELDNAAVVLYAGEIKEVLDVTELLKIVWGVSQDGGFANPFPLCIVAYEFSDDVKNQIVQARVQGKLPLAAIKAPFDGSPNARTQMLEDMASLLGGKVTARGIIDLKDIKEEHVGWADRIEIGAEDTVFFGGHGSEEEILKRVDDLKKQLETLNLPELDQENLRRRIGKLTGGIAVIKVGGESELEMKERYDRIEDALCAGRVAMAEGILPGGGYALYLISQAIGSSTLAENIMKEALSAPIKQIIANVGENPDVILSHMPKGQGYDAAEKEYVVLLEKGIVDPLKVTKSALENAVSIAGLLLTTGGAVVSDLESKDGQPNPLAAMMGLG